MPTPPPESSVLEIEHVSFSYNLPSGQLPVLEDVSLSIRQDDFLGLIGPNGGGKSTLLHLALGLLPIQTGKVSLFGEPPSHSRHRTGLVPQARTLEPHTPANVLDVVLLGALPESPLGILFGTRLRRKAMDALDRVGLSHMAKHPAGMLSGGQRQRVLLARALVNDPELLLLDEPAAGVDPAAGKDISSLLKNIHRDGMPIVVISHDLSFISREVTRVACLNRRLVVHELDAEREAQIEAAFHGAINALHEGECCPVHGHQDHCTHSHE